MKIGITGASGFIGTRLGKLVREQGHEVVAFSRKADGDDSPRQEKRIFSTQAPPDLTGLDAVVNLAGESIMGRWTEARKRRVLDSRVLGTRRLVEAMAAMNKKPGVLISGSAIGFYGDTGETLVSETSPSGDGFLAEVCRQWEAEAERAEVLGVRVIRIRIGFVLGRGGALKLMGPVFRLGLGGRVGDGKQWMSGVHVDDVAGLVLWAMENKNVKGPLNAVMPAPFRNEEFTREVAHVLGRPAIFPAPAFVLRTVVGEMSHMMLDNSRVAPRVAEQQAYVFRFASLRTALQDVLR